MQANTLFRDFLRELSAHGLDAGKHRMLIALSGGLDSVVLLHLFSKAGFQIGAAHANFGLRGTESEDDLVFCRELCSQYGITFHSKQFDTEEYASAHKVSIQMAARDLRYTWFESLIDSFQYDRVATGHQANDQAETVLLNLIDGRSPSTLAGIPQIRKKIVRPLLNFTRENLMAYAQENQIRWREDSTNASIDYRRNQVRHRILPELRLMNPSITETLHAFAERMRQWNLLADEQADSMLNGRLKQTESGFMLDVSGLLSHPASALLVQKALKPFGITASLVSDLLKAPLRSGRLVVTLTHNIHLDREQIFIQPITDSAEKETWTVPDDCPELITPGFRIQLSIAEIPTTSKTLKTEKHIALLDLDRVQFPLTIGPWEKGDRFQPLGMESFKKVSDYFIDNKVPIAEKEKAVLIRSQGEIVWIAGDRIDHRFRVSPETKTILKLTFLRSPH